MIDKKSIQKIMIILTLVDTMIIIVFLRLLSLHNDSIKQSNIVGSGLNLTTEADSSPSDKVPIESSSVTVVRKDYQGTMDDAILDIYRNGLVGIWHISTNMTFRFGEDGAYSGFFDSNIAEATNYTYQCIIDKKGVPTLCIYNKEKTAMVLYTLKLNDAGNIVLHFDSANIDIELKKGEK